MRRNPAFMHAGLVFLFSRGDIGKILLMQQRKPSRRLLIVVLVDTAGRMQDKNPLMKLINLNNPDLVSLLEQHWWKLALLASSDARSINGILRLSMTPLMTRWELFFLWFTHLQHL